MAFKPGDRKPEKSGKKKGFVNKDKARISDLAENLGIDVFTIMLYVASGDADALKLPKWDRITLRDRLNAAAEFAQYVQPKLKSIEHSGSITDLSGQREIERKLAMSPEARELSLKLEDVLKKVP